MSLEIHRKEKETPQGLVQRFTKMVRQSGVLLEIKKRQFHKRPKSHLSKKEAALRREEIKKEYERSKKMSKPSL